MFWPYCFFITTIDFGDKVQTIYIDIKNFSAHYCLIKIEINENPSYDDIKFLCKTRNIPWEPLRQIKKP